MENGSFIVKIKALSNARAEFEQIKYGDDPLFAPWNEAQLGEPVIVRTVFGKKSYWLVPVELKDKTIGFIRIMADGNVAAVGTFYGDIHHIDSCPTVITGIKSEEALNKIKKVISLDQGESLGIPIFVHDGPPGREAWLIEAKRFNIPKRWIFVTPNFVYERMAGELHSDNMEGGNIES